MLTCVISLLLLHVMGCRPNQETSGLTTQFVFLVSADGLRHQELFGGIDPQLSNSTHLEQSGIENLEAFREQYWNEDPSARRHLLMPFFWSHLAGQGVILGNRDKGSVVHLKNPHRFSYPSYAEILNGQPQSAVDSNDRVFSPRPTILEYLSDELGGGSPYKSAAFASWDVFNWIAMHTEGNIYCNAGYEPPPLEMNAPELEKLSRLQFDMKTPWDTVRHDAVTLGLAIAYIKQYKPSFFYLALGETDDWAHERRYDRMIQMIRLFDDALRDLWSTLQSMEPYRGRTTLVVTTDHGRGREMDDWTSHGSEVPGSEETWIAIFGPDTPNRGEIHGTPVYTQSHIAATILRFYGLEVGRFNQQAEGPIEEAFEGDGDESPS